MIATRQKELLHVVITIIRCMVAVVVAFVASMVTVSYMPDLLQIFAASGDSPFWGFVWFSCTGLAGVAAGSICLSREHRWIGSMFLLILGLGFTVFVFCMLSESDSGQFNFIPLISIGVGGIIPVIFYFFQKLSRGGVALKSH